MSPKAGVKRTGSRKTVLITGGGSGIGLALARVFGRCGYAVIISGRNTKRLQSAAHELKQNGADITAIACDIREHASVQNLFQEIAAQHPILDVLINNAGVAHALAPVGKLCRTVKLVPSVLIANTVPPRTRLPRTR